MNPEAYWWSLTEKERIDLERVVSHIVFERYGGNRALVLALVQAARDNRWDADPLVAAIVWRLQQEVEQ